MYFRVLRVVGIEFREVEVGFVFFFFFEEGFREKSVFVKEELL